MRFKSREITKKRKEQKVPFFTSFWDFGGRPLVSPSQTPSLSRGQVGLPHGSSPASRYSLTEPREQLFGIHRFGDIIRRASFNTLFTIPFHSLSGDCNNGKFFEFVKLADR